MSEIIFGEPINTEQIDALMMRFAYVDKKTCCIPCVRKKFILDMLEYGIFYQDNNALYVDEILFNHYCEVTGALL